MLGLQQSVPLGLWGGGPDDIDLDVARGYLQAGIDFEVRPYTETGPP